ncbi:MAG: hypothetical protein Q9157_001039 [Trypethelium eluteriae]
MIATGTLAASTEYQNLMKSKVNQASGQEIQKAVPKCYRPRPPREPSPFDASFPSFLVSCIRWTNEFLWQPSIAPLPEESTPLHPTAQLIQNHVLALPPFKDMTSEILAQKAVGIVLPSWLAATEEACHILDAVQKTFRRLVRMESTPSCAYTAAGYELCRISYEAFDCTGPGRISVLEYNDGVATASVAKTPLISVFSDPIAFSVRKDLTSKEMAEWIDQFIASQRPNMLMLAGANANDPIFVDAIQGSHASSFSDDHPHLPKKHILALGAALAAKDALESQQTDCNEPPECEEIRKKADEFAGIDRRPKPTTWPAIGPRHGEL